MLLQAISTGIYYSVELTMNCLEQKGTTVNIMEKLIKAAMNSCDDFLVRNIRGLVCILVEESKLPEKIRNGKGKIFNCLATLCHRVVELRKVKAEEDEDSSEEEEETNLFDKSNLNSMLISSLKDRRLYSSPIKNINILHYVKQKLEVYAKEHSEQYLLLEKQLTEEGRTLLQSALLADKL